MADLSLPQHSSRRDFPDSLRAQHGAGKTTSIKMLLGPAGEPSGGDGTLLGALLDDQRPARRESGFPAGNGISRFHGALATAKLPAQLHGRLPEMRWERLAPGAASMSCWIAWR